MKVREYTAVGETLSAESALEQAAKALDVAVKCALESRDIQSLIHAAMAWGELSQILASDSSSTSAPPAEIMKMGFTTKKVDNE